MLLDSASARRCNNLLLNQLPDTEFNAVLRHLELVQLSMKQPIIETGKRIAYVYFPSTFVASVVAIMQSGEVVEIGTFGNEGCSGGELLLGADTSRQTVICQITGHSLRMPADAFRMLAKEGSGLKTVTQHYLHAFMTQIAQSVACSRLHHVEARFARWLLMTDDRVQKREFFITHEFIATMLGVHRPTISLVATAFQQKGVISYSRGRMRVEDRQQLEKMSCECYTAVAGQYRELIQAVSAKP
jgi:CRP-like cAMP-binding protein